MKHCPACRSQDVAPQARRPNITILRCRDCALQFAEETTDAVIATDPGFHHAIDASYDEQLGKARIILPRRIAEYEKLLGRPMQSILEVGCATGAYARAYDELGIAYTGVEIAGDVARKARERTGLNIIHANFLDMNFDQDFDVFFCTQVLEHVPDPQVFLRHAISMTSGGIVHVDVPNHDGLTARIRKIHHKRDYGFIQPPYHLIAYNSSALTRLYKNCGLQVVRCGALPNDDPVWGQLVVSPSGLTRLMYRTSDILNAGSLLSAIGRVDQGDGL